jgi:hypothetical protein
MSDTTGTRTELTVTVTREGAVTVHRGPDYSHHIGSVCRAPGGRWESTTKSGRTVSRAAWTRADATTALVKRFYPKG